MIIKPQAEGLESRVIHGFHGLNGFHGLADSVRLAAPGGASEARAMALLARAEGWQNYFLQLRPIHGFHEFRVLQGIPWIQWIPWKPKWLANKSVLVPAFFVLYVLEGSFRSAEPAVNK